MSENKFSPLSLSKAVEPGPEQGEVVCGFCIIKYSTGLVAIETMDGVEPPGNASQLAYLLAQCLADATVAKAKEEIMAEVTRAFTSHILEGNPDDRK